MKKDLFRVGLVLVVAMLMFACTSNQVFYTVSYEPNGGSYVASQQVVSGGKATEPTAPTKSGYTFDAWYKDAEFAEEYDFETKVTSSFKLYAKWTENKPEPEPPVPPTPTEDSVTFVARGEKAETKAVAANDYFLTFNNDGSAKGYFNDEKFTTTWEITTEGLFVNIDGDDFGVVSTMNPEKEGDELIWTFDELCLCPIVYLRNEGGTYLDVTFVNETVAKVTYSVVFDKGPAGPNGGNPDTQLVVSGGKAVKPEGDLWDTVTKWLTSEGREWDFDEPIESDMTLYAEWGHIRFSGTKELSIEVYNGKTHWEGKVEYSKDAVAWRKWDGTEVSNSDGQLFFRGKGNTVINGADSNDGCWIIDGIDVAVSGNIMTLLEYGKPESAIMGNLCFARLFKGDLRLTNASDLLLPAIALADGCYKSMFENCSYLVSAPVLPATKLADNCYCVMFQGCTSLATAPALNATELATNCYSNMFQSCTSLTTAPALPATVLASYCYLGMFYGCTSLATAPALPATELDEYCYMCMFTNCKSLTSAPELPAGALKNKCYKRMFDGCTSLKVKRNDSSSATEIFQCPSKCGLSEPVTDMFFGTGGTFKGTPEAGETFYWYR